MVVGRRWTVHDQYGNTIYFTNERWNQIVASYNHPEMQHFETHLKNTIRFGRRKQDPLNFQKYRYSKAFYRLSEDNTHIVAIVLFKFRDENNRPVPNNYIVTAYQKEIR